MTRDRRRELHLLLDATASDEGYPWSYVGEVLNRLERAEQTHGDTWATRPAAELIAEAVEEAVDLAAWLLLAEQRLDPEHVEVRQAIREAIAAAERAWQALMGAPC